jgi:hypothetical protein
MRIRSLKMPAEREFLGKSALFRADAGDVPSRLVYGATP